MYSGMENEARCSKLHSENIKIFQRDSSEGFSWECKKQCRDLNLVLLEHDLKHIGLTCQNSVLK